MSHSGGKMKKIPTILSLLVLLSTLFFAPASAQEPVQCDLEYTIQAGDWLSKIAEKYLGDSLAYPELVELANALADDTYTNIDNADLIEPGWLICIPPTDETGPSPAVESDIVGIIWNWQGFTDQSEQNDIVVPNPDNYRMQLRPDGTYGFKADCNSGSGSYTLEGNNLTFSMLFATTLAECGPGSLYNDYLALLGQVASYVRDGDNLVLNLAADAGNMNFSKLQAVTGRILGPDGATLPEGAQVEIRVDDVSMADAPATQIGGQTIFDARQFPINFEAPYNAEEIDPRFTYGLTVRISDSQGKLLFINTLAYNVLTQGNPTYDVEVVVDPVGSPPQADSILDIVWQWKELTGTAVNPPQTIPNPENYTITFWADGTYSGQADCNRIGGTYSTENGGLTLAPEMATTMALCAPDSLDQDYLRLLGSVVAGGPDGSGGLALETAGGAERMVFQNGGPATQ
jgi:heat shock protein HslJ